MSEKDQSASLAAVDAARFASESDAAPHVAPQERHTCEELSRGSMWHRLPCGRTAKFHEESGRGGKQWFCGTHAPSERKRREVARREAWKIQNAPRLEKERKERLLRYAAPEMYEALKSLDAYWESGNFTRIDALRLKIRAAIAKAEGSR